MSPHKSVRNFSKPFTGKLKSCCFWHVLLLSMIDLVYLCLGLHASEYTPVSWETSILYYLIILWLSNQFPNFNHSQCILIVLFQILFFLPVLPNNDYLLYDSCHFYILNSSMTMVLNCLIICFDWNYSWLQVSSLIEFETLF